MAFRCLHDRTEIEAVLSCNRDLNLYSIGDLDGEFWPRTIWYGGMQDNSLEDVACVYASPGRPTLLALTDSSTPQDGMRRLLGEILYLLPPDFEAHLSPGLETVFSDGYEALSSATHYRMILPANAALDGFGAERAVRLSPADVDEMLELYDESYPGNWFNPDILETNVYYGIREEGRLVSISGTHIYSPAMGIAAVGNISTRPEARGRGLGTAVTAAICIKLAAEGLHIGLNVKTKNIAAIRSYENLGFIKTDSFGEFLFRRKADNRS